MKSKYFKIACFSAGLSLMTVASCKKFVEIDPPINAFNSATAYDNDDLVRSNIAGLHSYNFITGSGYYDTDSHQYPVLVLMRSPIILRRMISLQRTISKMPMPQIEGCGQPRIKQSINLT